MVRETRHLWVGNLPHTIREERILDHFKRYGKVQSVKILPKKEDDSGGACATVAFIDIKSAAKAHNADNKIEDRTLKTDYYEPPASSTASSAIYIHERDDALVRNPPASYSTPRTPRYGLSEERNYERPGHYYGDRESYLRRPLGMGYHDEDNYQGRAKSRDRYSRSNSGNTYTEGTDRNQNHFRSHNTRQHFEQQRYPVGEQYNDERDPAATTPRLNRRTNNNIATPVVASVASPTTTRSESRPRRTKRRSRSPSRTPSGSRSSSGSRSRSRSSSDSRSSSSSSKVRATSSDSSGRSRSPSKSRSPAASYASQNNAKGSRLDRPSSAIANPSSTVSYLPSAVNTSAINCTSNNTQGSTPTQGCSLDSSQNNCDKEEKRPLGICVRNLPVRSTDTSLKDGLFHEYKKHGKVTMVKVIGQGTDRYAVVCFKKPEDVEKALEVSKDKLFFGCKIEVTAHEGLDAEDNEFRPLEAELDEYHPKATRTLFIGNLEKDITTAELRKHFDQFGEIIEIDIKKQGTATSYAFIQYSDIASVVKAMRKLDGENLGANRIKLGFGKSMPTNCVWLDGVSEKVTESFLRRHINTRLHSPNYIAIDREKGHALVFFENVDCAQMAVSEMRGRILQGKKLQVDFASRECQTTFFEKLEMTGQLPPEVNRPIERDRRDRRSNDFEVLRTDDREARVGFENRSYPRYEGQARVNRGNFRGNQRTGFPGRGRGQNFPRYEVYHDEFGERRHRYRDESETAFIDGKMDMIKYADNPDCPGRKRNKLRNSISDQESHHSQSPPRSRHQSRSTSPVSKERKSLKDRLHHRIKSPGSHNSSLVNSPCRDTLLDDLETNCEYRDSRSKSSDAKMDDIIADFSYTSPRSSSEKEGSEKMLSKSECDSFRSRSSLDAESADESGLNIEQLGQLERKKRLLASSNVKSAKDTIVSSKSGSEKTKPKNSTSHNSLKLSKGNCLSEASIEDLKSELENINLQYECAKEKYQNDCANTELKYLKKRQVQILHLLDQAHESVNSSDNDCSVDAERQSRKKHRSSSTCLDSNSVCENDIKSHTKDECGPKMCKSSMKDPSILAKFKKTENVEDSNCVSLSLDSFSFRKHLDPRKGFDQHSVSLVNSLQKSRRISVDSDSCLPNIHGTNETFLCVPSSVSADLPWKKQSSSLSDVNFSENETDSSIALPHFKPKQDSDLDDEIVNKKPHLSNSHSLDLPKSFMAMRAFPDGMSCHDIKRERDISPLSLPLPKFAASLRSPKSSPSILTSPKSTTAHSPRAGHSPSYASSKSIRIPDLLHDITGEKKVKDIVPEDKVNGANTSPVDSASVYESQTNNDTSESIPSVEPIQSPKSNCDKIKECLSSSESDYSPSSSPNHQSIADRIKALDEIFNVWNGKKTTSSNALPDGAPSVTQDTTTKCTVKRSRYSYIAETRKEPSDIVKSLLARSTIFDQDSKRLQHIDEKYEPLNIKMDLSPKVKPTFRTKAAAKEFSTPITPTIQSFSQSLLVKSPSTIMVAQGIMSPPSTPQSATSSIVSPVTPMPQYTQLPPSVFTPLSPRSTSFSLSSTLIKSESINSIDKDISEQILKSPQVFNSVKVKADPNFHANSAALATSLKSSPLMCPAETPSHGSVVTSLTIKKEPASPTEADTQNVCNMEPEIKVIKKEVADSICIPIKKENTVISVTKDHAHFNSIDQDKKEFCDSKDPRLSFSEEGVQWRENGCKEEIKVNVDSSAKSYSCSEIPESSLIPAAKKRVSSIDSNESDSSKSLKSLESSRDSQETNWIKQERISEPELKKPKTTKNTREKSISPPPTHQLSKKNDKKDKSSSKSDKTKSVKSTTVNNTEKVRHENKCSKGDYKEKSKDHKNSKEEKRSKSKDLKDFGTKSEGRSKPPERRNSEKDNKISNNSNNPSNNKPKKDASIKTEKSGEKKQSEKKSKSNKFDFSAFIEDEPVYFSMYDKVKARSSKSQTLKHQTTSDLESVRQKFSKLKQSRAKREEKSKSVDHDSDKDSDSSHHSSESDSEAKPVKVKQPRKRKLVIESSSDDEMPSQDVNSQSTKAEKDFQSDSATDSDFDYNVTHRQAANKSRRKKTELLDSDSSDSDSNFPTKSHQTGKKKSVSNRSKSRLEKSKKVIKSDQDMSDIDTPKNQKSRDKDKSRKVKKDKEPKVELEIMDCDLPKRFSEDNKSKKKLSKDTKSESDLSPVQKKFKSDHSTKEKANSIKDKKVESSNEKVQSSEETEKHKPYTKKRKKSKKMCRNKDKRSSDKVLEDVSRKQMDESDTKSSLPVLLSPKPSSPLQDKQLSPPCLQAGVLSDNDFKSDFSDFDFENQPNEEVDNSRDMWKHLDTKSDTNSEKSSKCKKENISKPEPAIIHSPEQDSSLPSFFDKLSDITDSETGREAIDFAHDVTSGTTKHMSFSVKKEKDAFVTTSPHKSKHDKREDQNISKQDSVKYSENYSCPSKEERKRKKSKKQYKERRKKMKEDTHSGKDEIIDSASVSSPKASIFKTVGGDEDSRLSDIRLDEEIAEEARRLEQELLAASEETSTFGDDGPAKREEKLLERRFEEEAAKETRRLEAELLSTGRDSWHMKEKEYDSEANSGDICDDKHVSEMESMIVKEENIFAGLELHSSVAESSQNDADIFLSGHSESDPYKIDDKDVTTEIEDQRKIEDDLAVSALLQEMHCGEIPAPELTKESDYLEMEAHPDDTMNYLLPDDGENSLHIADSSPDNQGNESQEAKLESEDNVLSPSSNSEPPPALEISNVEESVLMKIDNENQASDSLKVEHSIKNQIDDHKSYQYHDENSLELCESKPPIIDLPNIQEKAESRENPLSPKSDLTSIHKKRSNDKPFRIPSKPDAINNEDTDDECSSDLTENQLTHFEDITNDTADSKDDDNPPVLLPVESPPNLIPVTDSKEQMEPLDKVTIDDNHCLDRIIGKSTTSDENIFSNVDLDKQIGDIINSITEKSKQLDDNDSFRMSGSHTMADLGAHNINDPLGLGNNANMFHPPKAVEANNSRDFNPEDVLKPSEKEVRNTDPASIPVSFPEEPTNKFQHPENQNSCILDSSILNYSEILSNSNCETSVIQSTQKIDNDAVTISITEKTNLPNIEQFQENQNNVSNTNHTSSDSFILELFGSKSAESFKVEPDLASSDKKKSTEFEVNSESKSKIPENDLSPLDFGPQREIKPLFEIPEVNEQNEATEFNQEIFEGPSDQNKEEQAPRLLSFSSEHLFSDNSSAKKEENLNATENSENIDDSLKENRDAKLDNNPSKSETDDNFLEYSSIDLHTNKEMEFEKKCDVVKEEHLNIEESLENKSRPADAESVCSDTTDITIPETKVEPESSQIPSIEEQVPEDVCPVEETEINIKPKIERPRRGRRPKTRRYVETSAQKSEPVIEAQITPPVNMRITRRSGGRPTSSERNLRSLRKDTSEAVILRDTNESKQNSAENPEILEVKKDDEITEVPINEPFETESSTTSSNSRVDNEAKLPEKSTIRSEEPRKRRGRRKKNSGDHSSDKMEPKFEEHESSKDVNRPKESRLLLSLSERDQKSTKENTNVDVYEFTESEDEGNTKFESVKERQENSRSNVSDSKHDNKVFDSVFEKKESNPEEPKSKAVCNEEKEVFKEYHVTTRKTLGKDHHVASKDHHVSSKETSSKGHHSTSKETGKETNSKDHRKYSKLHMVIRLAKDGDSTAEVIKTSEAIEVSKYESSKPERNSSSKHESVPEAPHNGPTTRKSTRLMNQSKNNYDKTTDDVVKSNSKSNNNSSSHPEPLPTRMTRRSRSSRKCSEESLPAPSESSNDTIEVKSKNEPVFFIPDNKEIPETKKNANLSLDASRASDSATSESEKNASKQSLRDYRMRNNKLESCKGVSHSSGIPSDQDVHKKESVSFSSADDKFDALQKEHIETKHSKETRSSVPENPPMPSLVLKVEISRVNLQTVPHIYPKPEKEEDSDSGSNRSSPAVNNDTKISNTKTSDSLSETPNSSSSSDKNQTVLVSDTPIIPPSKNVKAPVPEALNTSSVIQESSKVSQPEDSQISTRTRNRRSKINNPPPPPPLPPPLPAVTVASSPVQINVTTSSPDSSSKSKTVPIKKAAYNASVPVLLVTNTAVSTSTTTNTNSESIPVTSSSRILITQNQPPVKASLGPPVTTAVTQSSVLEKKEDVQTSGLPKISQGQSSVKAIVTPVVTQMPPGKPLPSNVQTKCSTNTTSTSSSVLMAPELPVVNSSANNPPTSVTTSSVNVKTVSLHPPMTSEQSNIPHEAHTTPDTSSWANSKVPSNRLTEAHPPVGTIQTSSINNPVFTTKAESRSSKSSHISKNSQFSQQSAFPLNFELSNTHNMPVVPELTQLMQQENFSSVVGLTRQLQERMQGQVVRPATPVACPLPPDIAHRLGQTSPHTPTPPVTSSNLSSEIHSPLHLRPSQSPLIVHSPSLHNETSFLNRFIAASPLNPYSMHPDIRVPQDAQVRIMGMNAQYAFSLPLNAAVPTNAFPQPTDRLQSSVMDAKSENQKMVNDLSKIVQESRGADDKALHSVKSGRSKKEDKDKTIHSERDDHESRYIPAHEKIPSTSAVTPHTLCNTAPYSSIHPLSQCLTVSPNERTDSPIIANSYAAGQRQVPQIPLSGQIDDHKTESLSHPSHFKGDTQEIKPPVAHQSSMSYHPGVLSSAGHIDGRSSNPAHSPSSHIYKKDSSHSQQISSLHNPATDKRVNSEHSKRVVHARTHVQGSSISPAPVGMPSQSPWNISHSSIAQPHVILSTNEQSSHRVNPHIISQRGSEVPVHVPPPAHTMPQSSNVPRTLPQTPPHASQVPTHDAYILRRYPVMWQGHLALKNAQASVQMHFVSGNPIIARASLPPIVDGEAAPVRISQRMRLDQQQLDGVFRKIQLVEEHCILMALPCGKDQEDLVLQSNNIQTDFITYLKSKNAAGIVNAVAPGTQQPAFVIHIFPSCDFINENLNRTAPSLLRLVSQISHLVIVIATV